MSGRASGGAQITARKFASGEAASEFNGNSTRLFTNPLTASPLVFTASLPKQKHSHAKSRQLRRLPGRKILVSFTTKCALPRQIKPRILVLELSIRRRQSNSSTVLACVSSEEIDCYRGVVSAGQLGATAPRTNHIFAVFSLYLSWKV